VPALWMRGRLAVKTQAKLRKSYHSASMKRGVPEEGEEGCQKKKKKKKGERDQRVGGLQSMKIMRPGSVFDIFGPLPPTLVGTCICWSSWMWELECSC
jgi:hypothetical protein